MNWQFRIAAFLHHAVYDAAPPGAPTPIAETELVSI
jgi:hypothetical protein